MCRGRISQGSRRQTLSGWSKGNEEPRNENMGTPVDEGWKKLNSLMVLLLCTLLHSVPRTIGRHRSPQTLSNSPSKSYPYLDGINRNTGTRKRLRIFTVVMCRNGESNSSLLKASLGFLLSLIWSPDGRLKGLVRANQKVQSERWK